jgi:hypothetical protein
VCYIFSQMCCIVCQIGYIFSQVCYIVSHQIYCIFG